MKPEINRPCFARGLSVLLAISVLAVASAALAQCPPRFTQDFDGVTPPALPADWVASQGVNVTGAPLWVTSTFESHTPPNDAFSTAPDNVLDNRLDTPVFTADPFGHSISFQNLYNLESGLDGAVLEISSPNINGGAFTDITDPAVGGSFSAGGYNTVISTAFQSPIAGRMAWSGNSGGYIFTQAFLGNAAFPPSQVKVRFRLASDNSGASPGWRIDTFSHLSNECSSPPPTVTPTATATVPPPPTPTPSATATATVPPTPTPSPTASPSPAPAQALNISTRLRVETGDRAAIGGFIVNGNAPKRVALRGLGPSLSNSGLNDALADPTLELRGSDGALIQQNDNWQDDPLFGEPIANLGLAPQNPNESALVATLPPGAYTAILAGKNQSSGLGLVEVYDVDTAAPSQLANISTRGFVQTADNVMIGGFILGQGSAGVDVAVRGIGPSLGQAGLTDVLPDPTLELHDGNGALLIANDDWQDDPVSAAQLAGHGLAPANSLESGIFTTLPPGLFTAILSGKNGGVGLGLVEVYVDVTTLIVTSTTDSGPGSLRDAIAVVGDGGTIQFDPGLNGQTITLTSGELLIDKSITISGPMIVQRSTADGTPAFRIFHVTPGHAVTMQGLTISNGLADMNNPSGGGVFNDQSTLTLSYCAVEYNYSAVGSGGGIYNSGSSAILTVAHSTVTDNVMEVEQVFMCCGGGFGAGIYSDGTLAIDHSTVRNNRTRYIQNVLSGDGGGIYISGGAVTISNSSVSGNGANRVAGGIFNRGTLEITNSTINYNFADRSGGGVYNEGTLEIDNSTFSGNSVGNLLAQGGGIQNLSGGTTTIIRTTFSENSADGDGGGIFNSGAVQIGNTILKANSTGGGNIFSEGGASTVTSQGYNLSSDNGGGFLTATGDQTNTDPVLGPLQDNGGPTFTHDLLTGSPAFNAGDPTFTPPPLYDQRGPGYDRVVGERIDIGSFEAQP